MARVMNMHRSLQGRLREVWSVKTHQNWEYGMFKGIHRLKVTSREKNSVVITVFTVSGRVQVNR